MIPYMIGKLALNSSHLTRGLVKYVPGRGYFRAVPSKNGDKYVTSPPPQSLNVPVFVLLVTASAFGPPRLHDPTRSLCLAPPKAGLPQPPVGPLAPVAPHGLQITAPDNDASAAAEPLLNTLLIYSYCDWNNLRPAGKSPKQPLPGMRLHDPLHDRQACPEFIAFDQRVGQICPRSGLFSCRSLQKRGQICYIPAPPIVECPSLRFARHRLCARPA